MVKNEGEREDMRDLYRSRQKRRDTAVNLGGAVGGAGIFVVLLVGPTHVWKDRTRQKREHQVFHTVDWSGSHSLVGPRPNPSRIILCHLVK